MQIQDLSVELSRQNVQEQAAVTVQAMAINGMEEQSAALARLMDSAEAVTDPNLGSQVNILA